MTFRLSSALRSRTFLAALGAFLTVPIATLGLASPSSAIPPIPGLTAQTFQECPVNGAIGGPHGKIALCIVGVAAQGTIDIGALDTTFHGPGMVQGGYAGGTTPNWIDALDGQSYSAPPQLLSMPVMAILGNPNVTPPADSDVYVVSQQAGPMGFDLTTPGQGGINPLTIIPLSFHLVNPLLGPNCYIGTDASPVTLNLTTGTSGALAGTIGTFVNGNNDNTLQTIGTEVVDGTFSTPGATGCGIDGVWDSAIDATGDLPSPSGANKAILYGNFGLAVASWVKHQLHE
jgi:hypothetical protein